MVDFLLHVLGWIFNIILIVGLVMSFYEMLKLVLQNFSKKKG